MKNILLILVGGTICTSINESGHLTVSKEAGILLKDNYLKSDSPYADKVKIDTTKNLYVLSENMTVKKWNEIIKTYRKYVSRKKYDGVILAHGTDTLAYSASIFSILFSASEIPVFFVSANENLKSDKTNGNDNFRCAVECICRGIIPNVYVPYKNISDGRMYIHLGSRLEQCRNYSEDFHSVGEFDVSDMTEDNYQKYLAQLEKRYPVNKRKAIVDILEEWNLKDCVLFLTPYVGLNYSAYRYNSFDAVLHGSFHSGTACAQKGEKTSRYDRFSVLYMLDKCFKAKKNIDVYFFPAELKGGTYETVSVIGNHVVNGKSIRFLNGYTYEMAYAKLVIAYSLFAKEEERHRFIYDEINYEVISEAKS